MSDDEIIKKLEETTMNAEQLQRETLAVILERNAGVRYLQPYLQGYISEPIDAATFRRVVPLSSYDDYADCINRLADGVLDDVNEDGQPLMSFDNLLCFFYRYMVVHTHSSLLDFSIVKYLFIMPRAFELLKI